MLKHLFAPESVALIGASHKAGKVGHDILRNLVAGGFPGPIVPVNPSAGEVLGLPVCADLASYPETIDQAVLAVPKTMILEAARLALAKGARSVVAITSGFKESGEAGAVIEEELAAVCRHQGARLVGPNCLGLINTRHQYNCSFAGDMPLTGGIAVFSQSGALCSSMLDTAAERHLGISKMVSVGNKADINENDLLAYLADDDDTTVIVGYLENIVDGGEFIRTASRAAAKKPVILLKTGSTPVGRRAASSHTGVLTGADTAYTAAFQRSGIIRADSFESLFDYAAAFSMQPPPNGKRVLIISNAGGPGVMAADACEREGLLVAELPTNAAAPLRDRQAIPLREYNPVDVLGDAPPERYGQALAAAQANSEVDAILILLTPQTMTDGAGVMRAILSKLDGGKPILLCCMGRRDGLPDHAELVAAGLPEFSSPEQAVATLKAMYEYGRWRAQPPRRITRFPVNRRSAAHILARCRHNSICQLTEVKAKKVMSAYGLTVPEGRLIHSADEAVEYARLLGFPVVMKVASPDIAHKSQLGGIVLGLTSTRQIHDSFDSMMLRMRELQPQPRIDGVYVERMIEPGLELILGMNRDAQFGPMLMFGLGGVYVEALQDVSFHLAPLTQGEAERMLAATRSFSILRSRLGNREIDVRPVAEALQRLSQLAIDFPDIMELDINPLIVGEFGSAPVVADARITIACFEPRWDDQFNR
ncbi:MAG: acetate--CoA ligase family protein [Desulfobulbaceae bacterium]|jgi:acetyltransferase|nr:acetate--CoA ligase family protein [Desulfobulbaceae bacterium]